MKYLLLIWTITGGIHDPYPRAGNMQEYPDKGSCMSGKSIAVKDWTTIKAECILYKE
jgi:hypothetical protein